MERRDLWQSLRETVIQTSTIFIFAAGAKIFVAFIGLITPPVGLNVFVISGAVGREVPVERFFAGIIRFLSIDVLILALIMAFPTLPLLIPSLT